MKSLIKILFSFFILFALGQNAHAQTAKQVKQAKEAAAVKELVESQNFVFQANYMYPMGGGQRYLNVSYYDLEVGKDTVTAFLPYFGVAYSGAGYNNSEDNGIKFTSTKFSYDKVVKSNGTSVITIKPQDTRTTNQMIMTVSPNGRADLSVISNNRQRIRFDGIIKQKAKTKK